jgi:hypothetical protein
VLAAVERLVEAGELTLKGFMRAIPARNIVRLQAE